MRIATLRTSALAALAPTISFLIGARILQGIAGGGVIASSLGIIGHSSPSGDARTHATGVWSAALGGGIAISPLAAAALADATGWRGGYWLVAAGAGLLVPAAVSLAESRADSRRPIAVREVAPLGVGMAALTAGLVEGRSDWTTTATIALLGAGGVLLAAFAWLELRRRAPIVDPRLFRDRVFVASVSGALFTGLAVVSLMSYALQRARHICRVRSRPALAAHPRAHC
jgi:MFS family permease